MTELDEQELQRENIQKEVESVWGEKFNWLEGPAVQLEGLPEGMRLVEVDTDTLVLRSLIPDAPRNENEAMPNDVPVAVFGNNADPKELRKEAMKIGSAIIRGDIRIDNAKMPKPPQEK